MRERLARRTLVSVAALALITAGCGPIEQPANLRQIVVLEVSLPTPQDRSDLLAILHRHAQAGGLHVDDVSEQWRQTGERAHDLPPETQSHFTKTIYVGLWRGDCDDDPEVLVDDGGHLGRPWVTFLKGKQPQLATKARVGLVAEINQRWPDTREVPVMPNGGRPLYYDLVWTGASYVVKPDRVAAYAAQGTNARP